MKTYQKFIIVFIGMGLVGGLSFLSSINPDWAMLISSANATIVGAVSLATGYKAE